MTVQVEFDGHTYTCAKDRPLLFTLQEQGAFIPSSCQSGICQTCLCKTTQGKVPDICQHGLTESLKAQGCFLACICKPTEDLSITLANKTNTNFEEVNARL